MIDVRPNKWCTDRTGKHEVQVGPGGANREPHLGGARALTPKRIECGANERNVTAATGRLRLRKAPWMVTDVFERMLDTDPSAIQVHIAPAQAQCFAQAETCRQDERVQMLVALSTGRSQKIAASSGPRGLIAGRPPRGGSTSVATFLGINCHLTARLSAARKIPCRYWTVLGFIPVAAFSLRKRWTSGAVSRASGRLPRAGLMWRLM
jgi:hypothetical protein